ncbi:hypothetical protein HYX01_00080 [Candidatus Woesearchaeota archaeon]|nr:hypothetical protein [Candidatus Woesearchaeota archaeon]
MNTTEKNVLDNRVRDILMLEERLTKGSLSSLDVSSQITDIVKGTLDKGTFLYGLRVLSELGQNAESLRELAKDYNARGIELGKKVGYPYDIDPHCVDYIVLEQPKKRTFDYVSLN